MYTLSLHDALPISRERRDARSRWRGRSGARGGRPGRRRRAVSLPLLRLEELRTHFFTDDGVVRRLTARDRKSTRLNSSHSSTSYAVFCLKKKNIITPSGTSTSEKRRFRYYSFRLAISSFPSPVSVDRPNVARPRTSACPVPSGSANGAAS